MDGNWIAAINTLRYANIIQTHYRFGLEFWKVLPMFLIFPNCDFELK